MKNGVVVGLLSLLGACASGPPASEPEPAASGTVATSEQGEVALLTAYPTGAYDDLGIVEFSFFRPGFQTPSLESILPELKSKVRDAGGNAFLVLNRVVDRADKRVVHISAEVLRVKANPSP